MKVSEAAGSPSPPQQPSDIDRPNSGRSITTDLLKNPDQPRVSEGFDPENMSDDEKVALNERLRAERFGIDGAIINEFAKSVVESTGPEGRPTFVDPITPRPIERRSYRIRGYVSAEEAGTAEFPEEGWYAYRELTNPDATAFEDFQTDVRHATEARLESWGAEQEAYDTKVWGWAKRLVVVGQEQAQLDVTEAIAGSDFSDDPSEQILKGTTLAPKAPDDVFSGFQTALPVENIADFNGNLAYVTLQELDRLGIADEAERLRALDDIVLQAWGVSQHHIAHFTSGELGEISDLDTLQALNPVLGQDDQGRYYLDWAGRVKPRPRGNMLSRTQHCPAAYRIEGEPSGLELLGWAFNTELQRQGLLAPGAADAPMTPPVLPQPRRLQYDEFMSNM